MADHPSSDDGKKRTTFLSLPAELRNYIYELSDSLTTVHCRDCHKLVRGDDGRRNEVCPVTDSKCEYRGKACLWVNRRHPFGCKRTLSSCHVQMNIPRALFETRPIAGASQPNLTKVSRQVRVETLPMYYGNPRHVFMFTILERGEELHKAVARWFSTIGKVNAKSVKQVMVIMREMLEWWMRDIREVMVEQETEWAGNAVWKWVERDAWPYCCEAVVMPREENAVEHGDDAN